MWETSAYVFSAHLFIRLLGLVYFFAFGAFLFQYKGLFGKGGILPIAHFLHAMHTYLPTRWRRLHFIPTLLWWNSSDRAICILIATGTVLSLLLVAGIYPSVLLILLFVLYLSIVSAGQEFLGFGWEGFLLEITANAFFVSLTEIPNPFIWFSLNLLLFRFHFEAGTSKLQSEDPNWRNLTAVFYHYQSQPIPNVVAWFIFKLPLKFHQFSTALMFFVELVMPFAIFGTHEMRLAAFISLIGLQYFIWLTGNFSFLNHMTAVLCLILLADSYWEPLINPRTYEPTSWAMGIIPTLGGLALLTLQSVALWNHYYPSEACRRVLRPVSPFHLGNRYGIFAIMTTKRYEIVIEGSQDGSLWLEYSFPHKPSEITRRPRRISPYQPRLDWQMWFLPFVSYGYESWFKNFLTRLLEGSPDVIALLHHNPFPHHPPRFIRAVMYDYTFSDWETLKSTGAWWQRRYVGRYSPTLNLYQTHSKFGF